MVHVALNTLLMRQRRAERSERAHASLHHSPLAGPTGIGGSTALWAAHLHRHVVATPLGPVLLAASEAGLAGLWFQGQRHDPQAAWRGLGHQGRWASHPVLFEAQQQIEEYFDGRRLVFHVPLDLSHSTPFQREVLQALCQVPAGKTIGYGELARRVGAAGAARAVGMVVGRNPISIIVPCHRVVGAKGGLTGYAGGLDRKRALLEIEGILA